MEAPATLRIKYAKKCKDVVEVEKNSYLCQQQTLRGMLTNRNKSLTHEKGDSPARLPAEFLSFFYVDIKENNPLWL